MKIVIAILIFSIIIIFHEFGHLLLAKKNGIKVVEFSVGLGPTIIGKEIKGTKYSLKLLPFGGACQMLGEDFDDGTPEEGSFYAASVWQRMSVILAGPFFNFLLAFVFALVITGSVGFDAPLVTGVAKGSAAETAGLRAGDEIVSINGSRTFIGRQIDSFFLYNELDGSAINVKYKRDGVTGTTSVTPVRTKRYLLGFTYTADTTKAEIKDVSDGYPIAAAGIEKGDVILKIDGNEIATGAELSAYMNAHPLSDESVVMTYERNGGTFETTVTPRLASDSFSTGMNYNLYRERTGVIGVIKYSFIEVGYWIDTTIKNLGMLIRGKLTKDDIGGAIAIVDMIGDSYEETKETGSAFDVVLQMLYISILLS
ncbi:MAG: RIP metalloprotease RseP, partial [Lachnospiraceae bacterium]|nr:RIP metalloprotease RseP [Lachnospiraceae bacterium]